MRVSSAVGAMVRLLRRRYTRARFHHLQQVAGTCTYRILLVLGGVPRRIRTRQRVCTMPTRLLVREPRVENAGYADYPCRISYCRV